MRIGIHPDDPPVPVVEMTDSVETALRRKKDSSLRVAVSQVKPHADRPSLAQACVSAGNTGALMAVSRYVLKTVDGIDRPAIATVMPNERDGFTTVLDLGANVDCTRRAPAPVRGHGQRARRRGLRQGRADGRPAQHRRRSDQGQRDDQAGGRAAARGGAAGLRQLPRQRRGQRHLQGHDRHRRLRRLRRQRDAEDRRRAGVDADDASSSRSSRATPLTQLAALAALPVLNRFKHARRSTAATTAPRCSACAAWSSRATARPTRSPSSRRSTAPMMRRETACSTASSSASAPPSRRCRRPRRHGEPTGVRRHHGLRLDPVRMTHRTFLATRASAGTGSYLPPGSGQQCRPRRAARQGRHRDLGRVDRRAHRHPLSPFRRARRRLSDLGADRVAARARGRRLRPAATIDLIIVATRRPTWCSRRRRASCRTSSASHGCAAFDVQAVCSGFVYALTVADSMIKTGAASKALVIGAEVFSRILDFKDRTHLRAVRRRRRRRRPRGERDAGHPRERAARRRPPRRHPVRAGQRLRRQGPRRSAAEDGRPGGVQARRRRARERRPLGARRRPAGPTPTSTG